MPGQNRGIRKPPVDPKTPPGEEGRGAGKGLAVEEAGELPVQSLRRHSHTNRTLDSLNNVGRPLY